MSTITVTPTAEPSSGGSVPRVRLDVSDANIPAYTAANVVRHDPGGRTVPVRTPDGNALTLTSSGVTRDGLVYDYEAPFGLAVRYSTLEDPATISAEVTLDEPDVWLIHPGVPELSRPLSVASLGPRIRPVVRTVYRPLGRATAITHTDGARKGVESTIELNTLTLSEVRRLEALTQDASVLLLNVPDGLGWGVATTYISVGDITESRLYDYAGEPRRYHELPYAEESRPAGGTQAERTWTDLIVNHATWADVLAAYDSWFDVLAGP